MPDDLDRSRLKELPRLARVAFAARCPRHALSYFTQRWRDAPRHDADEVAKAVRFAEQFAAYAARSSRENP